MKSLETNDTIVVEKGWGLGLVENSGRVGEVFVYHRPNEKHEHQLKIDTVKVLYFGKQKRLSLHFHAEKEEVFCIAYGKIKLEYILKNGDQKDLILSIGDRIFIPKNTPHRMIGLEEVNILIEASTLDDAEDSYRIARGD